MSRERDRDRDPAETSHGRPPPSPGGVGKLPNSAVAALARSMAGTQSATVAAAALRRGDHSTLARLVDSALLEELEDDEDEVEEDPAGPVVARAVGLITADEAEGMGGGSPNRKDSGNYARIVTRLKQYEKLKLPGDAAQRKALMGQITGFIAAWRGDAAKRAKASKKDAKRGTILDRLETQIGLAMGTASGQLEDPAADPTFRATHELAFPTMPAYLDFLRHANTYAEPHFWTDPKVRFEHAGRKIKIAYDPLELQEIYPGFRAASQTTPSTPDEGYRAGQAQGAQALKDDSAEDAAGFDFAPYDAQFGQATRQRLTAGLAGKNQVQAIDYLLNDMHEGFAAMILSESHGDAFHKKFLVDNMAALKAQGVDTIYIELIRTEYQAMVDQFLNTPPFDGSPQGKQMSPQLQQIAAKPTNNFKFDDLLYEAKVQRMRVVGIDGLKASKAPGAERAMTMNHLAHEIITGDRVGRQNGKYALLIGAAHSHTHAKDATKGLPPVPGLAELLNVPAVEVSAAGVGLHSEDAAKRT